MIAPGPFKSVLVVGGGIDAWMTAAALAHAGRGVLDVVVAEIAPPAQGRIAALPTLWGLHARLGLAEEAVVRAARATPRLAARYREAVEPFGETGAALEGLPFHQHWLRARSLGETAPLSAWSLAAQAAARGRFAPRSPDPRSPLSTLDHGLALDAAGYADLLKTTALEAGARLEAGAVRAIDKSGGRVTAVVLADGRRLAADLFVDATGEAALLIGDQPWIDWSAWLPTGLRLVDDDALVSSFAPAGPVRAGRRARAMAGGVVAVGAAHGVVGLGDGGDLQLVHGDVSRLVALLPTGPAAAAEYNRLAEAAIERARDMAILRWGELADPPEPLAWKLAQFESRGRVVTYDEEAWPDGAFVHAMLARGIVPRRWDPLVERMPAERAREVLDRMRQVLEQTAEAMPRV